MKLASMNLNLLVALDALLREKNVSRAAELIGVTQSAMSHTLRSLRELLGDPLLVREGNKMILTPFAERVREKLQRGLSELEEIVSGRAAFDPAATEDTFTFATHDGIASYIASSLFHALKRSAPRARLKFVPVDPKNLSSQLLEGEVDLAITAPPVPTDGLLSEPTGGKSGFSVLCRRDHPLVKKKLTLKQYCKLQHLMPTISGEGPSFVDRLLEKEGLKRNVEVKVPFLLAEFELVAHTDLVSAMPTVMAKYAERLWPVRRVPFPLDFPESPLLISWHPRFDANPTHLFLRGVVSDAVQTAVEERGEL